MDATDFARLTRPFPEPCLLVSREGLILAANAAALRALEVGDADLVGRSLLTACADTTGADPTSGVRAYLGRCAASGQFLPGSLRLAGPDGKVVRYRCEAALVRPAAGGEPALLLLRLRPHQEAAHRFVALNQKIDALAREIQERRRAEEELQAQAVQLEENAAELELMIDELERQKQEAQQANRAKADFLAVMSHELRTPLNAIVGYVDLLDAEVAGPVSAGQRQQLARIQRGARHLVTIIDDILEFARLEAGRERIHLEPVDLAELAREAADLIEPAVAQQGLSFVVEIPTASVPLHTDPAKTRQILLNLLSNAVKFTDIGEVGLAVASEGEEVTCRIWDTGIGIAPDDLEHIFEPFWQVQRGTTRRVGGTGLGLTVTRRLAQLLGGDLSVVSEPGSGSTFTLRLPHPAMLDAPKTPAAV